MSEKYTAEQIERAAVFYEQSPTGQYDDEAAYALRELTTLRAENAKLRKAGQELDEALHDYLQPFMTSRSRPEITRRLSRAIDAQRAALQAGENE